MVLFAFVVDVITEFLLQVGVHKELELSVVLFALVFDAIAECLGEI